MIVLAAGLISAIMKRWHCYISRKQKAHRHFPKGFSDTTSVCCSITVLFSPRLAGQLLLVCASEIEILDQTTRIFSHCQLHVSVFIVVYSSSSSLPVYAALPGLGCLKPGKVGTTAQAGHATEAAVE